MNNAIKFGRGTYVETISCPWPQANLIIGNFCSVGSGVQIFLGGNHRKDWTSTYNFKRYLDLASDPDGHPATNGNVVIGNDVWIGQDATIMSGVHIGDGAIIGAKAVVASGVLPYAIAVGNPARIVRFRFMPEVIARLLSLSWWNWDDEKIRRNLHLLNSHLTIDVVTKLEEAT